MSILERLLVTLYLCISFAQGKVLPPHQPEPQGLTMAKKLQEGWFEKTGCHPENDEYQQSWRQREARHVEEQSLHSDTNPYEEHENSYDEEPSDKSLEGETPEIVEDVEAAIGTPPNIETKKS